MLDEETRWPFDESSRSLNRPHPRRDRRDFRFCYETDPLIRDRGLLVTDYLRRWDSAIFICRKASGLTAEKKNVKKLPCLCFVCASLEDRVIGVVKRSRYRVKDSLEPCPARTQYEQYSKDIQDH